MGKPPKTGGYFLNERIKEARKALNISQKANVGKNLRLY
jgi:hypothetical protein